MKILIIIITLIIAAFFDLKQQGLGYKLMPNSLKQKVDQFFKRA